MKVPVLKQKEFVDYLKQNGFEVIDDRYWNDFNRIIFGKNGLTFPLQMQEKYFYPTVCRICKDLNIEAPEDHQKAHEETINLKRGNNCK